MTPLFDRTPAVTPPSYWVRRRNLTKARAARFESCLAGLFVASTVSMLAIILI